VQAGGAIAQFVGDVATRQAQITKQLQLQQDQLDVAKFTSLFNAELAAVRVNLTQNTNYAEHEKFFAERGANLVAQFEKLMPNATVANAFRKHVYNVFPEAQIAVRGSSNKLWLEQQKADLLTQGDFSAQRAIDAPLEYDETINKATGKPFGFATGVRDVERQMYHTLVDKWFKFGAISSAEQREFKKNFDDKVLKGSMEKLRELGKRDPAYRDQLFDLEAKGAWADLDTTERTKIFNLANADAHAEQARNDQAVRKVGETILHNMQSRVLTRDVTVLAELEDVKHGRHPFITPDKYPQLKSWWDNPPSSAGNVEAMAIMDEYNSAPRSFARIDKYWAQMRRLRDSLPESNKQVSQFLETFQRQEATMRAEERTLDTQARVALHEEIRYFNNEFDAVKPPEPMFEINKGTQRRQVEAFRNELIAGIRSKRMSIEDALKKAKERFAQPATPTKPGQPTKTPTKDKSTADKVLELLK